MKTLGAMQPYFFPYLGYFDLINRADTWVVFDVVKYARKSWMNRNRVLHPTEGWQYVTVPVQRAHEDAPISEVRVLDKDSAFRKIAGQLQHYRKARAPHFSTVLQLLEQTFGACESDRLVELNVRSLATTCSYLGIAFSPVVLSEAGVPLPPIEHPGQWALELTKAFGHDAYVNPPGGAAIFRPEEFESAKIRLHITELVDFRYPTGPYPFVERLSILDVLMWSDPRSIRDYLNGLIHAER
jgi:hypothetical protein